MSSSRAYDVTVRVLVVEDNEILADRIAEGLRDQGMAVDVAYDGDTGLEKAELNAAYDVVVLDRDLPRRHGDEVCAQLTGGKTEARILMLTAAGSVDDRVYGLTLGADDYLSKPFAFDELVARIRSLARRSTSSPPVLRRHDIELDRARRTVSRSGRSVNLTRKELSILEVLLAADGAAVSAEQLLEQVWDEFADPFTNTVAVTVGRLRRKLGPPAIIETQVGSGYRIP
jgi:DNA-binding response OmpR family regulator